MDWYVYTLMLCNRRMAPDFQVLVGMSMHVCLFTLAACSCIDTYTTLIPKDRPGYESIYSLAK